MVKKPKLTVGLSPKVQSDLATFYESDQFTAFTKLCESKREKIAIQILATDARESAQIAILQGQYNALEFLLLEIKSIHKLEMAKENDAH